MSLTSGHCHVKLSEYFCHQVVLKAKPPPGLMWNSVRFKNVQTFSVSDTCLGWTPSSLSETRANHYLLLHNVFRLLQRPACSRWALTGFLVPPRCVCACVPNRCKAWHVSAQERACACVWWLNIDVIMHWDRQPLPVWDRHGYTTETWCCKYSSFSVG